MKNILLLYFFVVSAFAKSQSFEMDDTVKTITKTTASITPPHDYFQFYNYTGDSLHIRWRVNHLLSYYPVQWGFALQDNETYHNPIVDSNDITIPDSAGTNDKIILNVFHNQIPGHGELVIDLINLDSVQEVFRIKFIIDITSANSIDEFNKSLVSIYPVPSNDILTIELRKNMSGNLQIIDPMGRSCSKIQMVISENEIQFPVSELQPGLYFIKVFPDYQEPWTVPFMKH